MLASRVTVQSDGVTATLAIPFGFLAREHVAILVDDEDYTGSVTWVSDSQILLAPVPANGAWITALRNTPVDAPRHSFSGGTLASPDLNANQTQDLFALQESADEATRGLVVSYGESGFTIPKATDRANMILAFDGAGAPDIVSRVNVDLVASIAGYVVTVGGIAAAVTTVATYTAQITTLVAAIGNINTVALNIGSVNYVSANMASVLLVAGNLSVLPVLSQQAALALQQSIAAADVNNVATWYDTKALLNTAAPSLPANRVVGVLADESVFGHRTLYRIVAGAASFRADLDWRLTFGDNPTRADLITESIPALVSSLTTGGYTTAGDRGGGRYKRVAVQPTHAGKFQSADGAWWELDEQIVTPEMFGAVGDDITDDIVAFENAIAYRLFKGGANRTGGCIRCSATRYYLSRTLHLDRAIAIEGYGAAGMGNNTGSTHLRWPAGVTWIRAQGAATLNDYTGLLPGGDAAGWVLRRLWLSCETQTSTDRTKHGVDVHTRGLIEDCKISGASGNGIHINPNGSENANCFQIVRGHVLSCQNGLYVNGADSNAGLVSGTSFTDNRGWGVWDSCFLGNHYVGVHTASNGALAWVSYGGNRYYCLDATLASTTAPDTNSAVWAFYQVGGVSTQFPAWVSGHEYVRGGPFLTDNVNNYGTFVGCYTEAGQPLSYVSSQTLVLGGEHGTGWKSVGMFIRQGAAGGFNSVSSKLLVLADVGATVEPMTLHNQSDPAGGTRTLRTTYNIGYKADGVTLRPAGGVYTKNATTQNTRIGLEYYDTTADALAVGVSLWGQDKTFMPGTDMAWSTGSSAVRWLLGYMGNVKLFPAASVTPAANGEVTFQLTSDTQVTVKVKGSDGIVRQTDLPLKTSTTFVENTATYDPPSLAVGSADTIQTMTVTGASLGDFVDVSFSLDLQGLELKAWVSAANTVKYQFRNPASGTAGTIDLASGTVKCRIRK